MPTERGQLVDRRRPLQIRCNQQRRTTLFFQIRGQLCRRRRLTSAVEADHQNAGRLFQVQRRGVTAKKRRQLLVKNFNDLLAGRDAPQHFLTERLFFDPCDELLRDLEIDVRFQQR